jgi:single-strand DNA-binding protein
MSKILPKKQIKVADKAVSKKNKKVQLIEYEPVNEVFLVGRVTSLAVEKVLPSGDKVVEFRLVIGRKHSRGLKKEVDALDIAAWSAKARRAALTLKVDSWVEITGSVRRRFWRAPTGLASRWQVEASDVVRL